MEDEFMGIIKLFAGGYAPLGWCFCDGSLLPIQNFQGLFSVIGTTYGGDGKTNFRLPDLRSRVPIGACLSGQGPVLTTYSLGQSGGSEIICLTQNQLPLHNHALSRTATASVTVNAGGDGTTNIPKENYWGSPSTIAGNIVKVYTSTKDVKMASDAVTVQINGNTGIAGGLQPVNIMQPYLALNYIICVEGLYPPRP